MPRFSPFAIYLTGLGSWFVPLGIQQVLFAAYQSMGAGQRVDMPFDAYGVKKPIDLWFNPKR